MRASCAYLLSIFLLILAQASSANAACGLTSWYAEGTRTANGERFKPDGMTAAHRTLPIGTVLNVTYSGRSVRVRINDRGPAARTGRVLDLSRGAARALGIINAGIARVCF